MIRCAECGQTDCDKEACPGWSTERPLFDRTWTAESLERRREVLEPLFMAGEVVFPAQFGGHPFAAEYQMIPTNHRQTEGAGIDTQR